MQKIYVRGIGAIPLQGRWVEIKKPENFRSPQRVLDVINAIRADGDGLHQVSGLPDERRMLGEVNFFVLPADGTRTETLEKTRGWLRANSRIGAWTACEGGDATKILVIAHRMAARRLGFENLYDVFHSSASLRDAFDEGRAWPIAPFLTTLVPLANAATSNRAQLIPLLRNSSPLLRNDGLRGNAVRQRLRALAAGVDDIAALTSAGGAGSVESVLRAADSAQLIDLDERFASVLSDKKFTVGREEITADTETVVRDFLACNVREIVSYFTYLDKESPYSTHQGVKGAEYPNVLVVLDDEEGRHNQFSYEKLLGIKPLSPADRKREENGEETIVSRTRRLLYVCASRATETLAIVLYATNVESALQAVKASGIPGADGALTVDDL